MKPEKEKLSNETFAGLSEEDQQFITFLANILVDDAIRIVLNKNTTETLPGEPFPGEGENILVDE